MFLNPMKSYTALFANILHTPRRCIISHWAAAFRTGVIWYIYYWLEIYNIEVHHVTHYTFLFHIYQEFC